MDSVAPITHWAFELADPLILQGEDTAKIRELAQGEFLREL